jgi:VanZ family protein
MPVFSVSYLHYQVFRGVSLALAGLLIFAIFGMADSSLAKGALSLDPPLDKLLHAAVYGIIAGLLHLSRAVRPITLLWLMVIGIAVLDELHQLGIAGREASLLDLLADGIGITISLWATTRMQHYFVRAKK